MKNNDMYADKAYQLSAAKITESAQELGMLMPIIKEKRQDYENQTTPGFILMV
ncbi:MAG: hypothetical protein PHD43_10405 [Methylococcales bacterium]|nr:hypothetical protein [Methylococcales bacterium]